MRLLGFLFFVSASVVGILFSLPVIVQAQQASTINGTLTDPSGAAIVGASVVAQRLDVTSANLNTQSGRDGRFSLVLNPGRYLVSFQHPSFTRVGQEFTLAVGEVKTWDVKLTLEKMSSTVVVTALAEPSTAETTPALVDVITKQEIEDRQDIWLITLLDSGQGVSSTRLGPVGGVSSFFLDGGNSDYTKVLVDGAPVNQPGGAVDLSNFTSDGIDKIETVHGASSALYGSDAMTGVVQIFTHRGTSTTPELILTGEGGSFDTGRGGAQLSGLVGKFDYSANAGYYDTNGQGPGDFFRDTTLGGNFGYKFSDPDTVRLSLRNNSSDAGQPGQTLLPGGASPRQTNGLQDFSANLAWNFQTGEHWQNQLSGYESRYQEVELSPEFSSVPFITKYNRAGLDAQSTYSFQNGSITAGYMFEVENGSGQNRQNQAGYLEARYRFGRRLNVIAGGRAEDNGFFGTRVVPRVGASYALRYGQDHGFWGATRLRTSYGLGIKEPEIFPVGCSPILDPERSTTVDAGIDQYFASDRVHVSVTYFHNDFRDIVSFIFGSMSPNCLAFGGSFFNTDLGRASGVNSAFETKVTRWLRVIGNYSYDDSKVIKSPESSDLALTAGNRLFLRPLHSANLIANARFLRMNWNLAGYYTGRRADSDFLSTTVDGVCTGLCIKSTPAWVRWDLSNSINLGHGLSTQAHVENLFNNHYQDAVGYPALRLNFRVGIRYVLGGEQGHQ
jgi:outer membrane cobalamin receptor